MKKPEANTCQTNTCNTPRSMRSWLTHIKGATALLEMRGEEQLDSELGRSLFVQARTQVVAGCYQTRSPIPDVVVNLSRECRHRRADPLEDLNVIISQFCAVRADLPFHPPTTQSESTTREAIAQYTSIAEAFADWHADLPATYHPLTIPGDPANPDILSDHQDVYAELWTANLANNYRANSILVHEALLGQLGFLRFRYSHDLDEVLELEDQAWHSRNTVLSLIDAVCASVPDLLQSNLAAAGVGLLWPLYVSAQISPRSTPVPDATRAWMVGRLDTIGNELGVRQATMLAGLLRKETDLSEVMRDE